MSGHHIVVRILRDMKYFIPFAGYVMAGAGGSVRRDGG